MYLSELVPQDVPVRDAGLLTGGATLASHLTDKPTVASHHRLIIGSENISNYPQSVDFTHTELYYFGVVHPMRLPQKRIFLKNADRTLLKIFTLATDFIDFLELFY